MNKDKTFEEHALSEKLQSFRRLIIARITFQQVIAACDNLIGCDEHAHFYGIFFTGICVSYMRPFKSADGFGSLSTKYRQFKDYPAHAMTHKDLAEGRNSAYAHYSPNEAASLLATKREQEEQKRIRISVDENQKYTFGPPEITWPRLRLPAIVSLCQFQIERVVCDLESMFSHLCEGKTYPPGEYILGETFP